MSTNLSVSERFERIQTGEVNGDIIQGDCLSILKQLPDSSIDLIFTDPPYGINYLSEWPSVEKALLRPTTVPISNDSHQIWKALPEIAQEFYRVAKPNTSCLIFTRWNCWEKLKSVMSGNKWHCKNMIVWDKGNHTAGDIKGNFGFAHELIYFGVKGRPLIRGDRVWNIWRVPRVFHERLIHPAQKPLGLITIGIRALTDVNDIVLDPFIGSGTTAMAASWLDRRYFGCDIEKTWIKTSLERITVNRRPQRWVF